MPLTVKQIEALNPGPSVRKVADGGGLVLVVKPNGSKLWQFRYRVPSTKPGRRWEERTASFGAWPEVSLREARERRDDARRLLRDGGDPVQAKRAALEAAAGKDTFRVVALEWLSRQGQWDAGHVDRVRRRLEKNLFPTLGDRPIRDITPAEVLRAVEAVAKRGALDVAKRSLQTAGQVFRYAIPVRCDSDPTRDLRGKLPTRPVRHHAAIIEPKRFGELLRAIDAYDTGEPTTRWALQLQALVFLRPGELRALEWAEVDLDSATITIPAHRMKMRADHVVPLAKQAVAILKEANRITGASRYVFPAAWGGERPMSEATMNAALARLGFPKTEHVPHGFRGSARTMLDEQLGFPPHLIEHQLAHEVRDPLGRAYNRTKHLPQRREMMQRWADWLDERRRTSANAGEPV